MLQGSLGFCFALEMRQKQIAHCVLLGDSTDNKNHMHSHWVWSHRTVTTGCGDQTKETKPSYTERVCLKKKEWARWFSGLERLRYSPAFWSWSLDPREKWQERTKSTELSHDHHMWTMAYMPLPHAIIRKLNHILSTYYILGSVLNHL